MAKDRLPENTILDCLNCGSKIHTSDSYCQTCGQKIKTYRPALGQLLREVFASIFNLESKFAKTILNIWRPVYLTRAYIKGERKRFLNPGRLFIVSFFLLSALLSIFLKSERENIANNDLGQDLYHSEFKKEMLTRYDTLVKWYPTVPQTNMDTIRHEMFMSKRSMAKDSVSLPPLFKIYGHSEVEKGDFKISTKDIRELSKEELFEKYKVEKLVNQVLFLQLIKLRENPTQFVIFIATNSLWAIVLSTFLVASFMQLLYIRSKYYYVEHVVFLMLFQSLIFIAAIAAIILSFINSNYATNLLIFIAIFGSLYFIVCLKIYYQQGLFKTIVKSILIRFAQIIFLVLCSAVVLGFSFLLY